MTDRRSTAPAGDRSRAAVASRRSSPPFMATSCTPIGRPSANGSTGIDSAALRFIPYEEMEQEGYGYLKPYVE